LEFNVPFQHKYGYIRDEAAHDARRLTYNCSVVVDKGMASVRAVQHPNPGHRSQRRLTESVGTTRTSVC